VYRLYENPDRLYNARRRKPMKYFDLSVPLYHNCPGWPTYRLTEFNYEAVHGNDGFIAEHIFPKELLKYESCAFTAVPLKLQGFGGSPTRAYAAVE
jgi:kynurenine formamidase